MIIKHPEDVPSTEVEMEGAEKVKKRALIMKEDGTPSIAMRLFELGEGGHTPFHAHEWEHINYIVEGDGFIKFEGRDVPLKKGDSILVPAGEKHQYRNAGKTPFKFLCMVPKEYG